MELLRRLLVKLKGEEGVRGKTLAEWIGEKE